MKEQEAMENPGLWVFKNCTPADLGFYDFSEGENHIVKPTFYKREIMVLHAQEMGQGHVIVVLKID